MQCVQALLLERRWMGGRANSCARRAAQELPDVCTDGL
jgi:hypothetical protein